MKSWKLGALVGAVALSFAVPALTQDSADESREDKKARAKRKPSNPSRWVPGSGVKALQDVWKKDYSSAVKAAKEDSKLILIVAAEYV